MRQFLLLLCLLDTSYSAFAQVTLPPARHAILESRRQIKGQVSLTLFLGSQAASKEVLDNVGYVKSLTNEVDGLDYLAAQGWEIVDITQETFNGHTCGTRYYLRKSSR